ncbi:MAG TPA: HD domain-containing phosphohydrolase [Terriglobales bacterium]|nr:HD domain-containing phosphohydrolase [Terriglobales bacterium]
MSTSFVSKPTVSSTVRLLPLLVSFDEEIDIRRNLLEIPRYRHLSFENSLQLPSELERIVISGHEQLLSKYYEEIRRPTCRLIGMTDHRFHDPRIDALVYAYLPANTPHTLLERTIDNALDHIHLIHVREQINERLRGVTREIEELNKIGAALSAEHHLDSLLELILTKSRHITNADAGSLYLVEAAEEKNETQSAEHPPALPTKANGASGLPAAALAREEVEDARKPKRLRFKLAQNDSIDIPFRESTMEINHHSIAGYVASTGEIVNIEDAYHVTPEVPYSINRSFDEDSGYRTKSILAVPLRDQKDRIAGVLQLINAKRDGRVRLDSLSAVDEQVVSFNNRQQDIVASLGSQAAVAVENSRLYESIQRLFEGFVRASVIAIEARDPTTSGHSFRVANLTVALAEAVQRVETGPYADLRFTREEMREIRYASLLHDFGKVGVREEVLVKAKKLYPAQLELVKQRFEFVKRSMQVEKLQQRLDYVLEKGREEYLAKLGKFDEELREQLEEVDRFFSLVLKSDEPTVLPEGSFERLLDIAARHYHDFDGGEKPLITPDEVRLLSIRKGSLDDQERQQIESHVVHTFNFLQQIPWTSEIRNIPEIARGHHEKLNGLGYPYKLSAPEIPVQTRMMTISDIFDALSAADRPYKRAVDLERALQILSFAVKDGELDGSLFQIFVDAKVFERWKIEAYPY